jgi:inorganic pyrophosphatase
MTDAGTLIDFCSMVGLAFAFFLFWKVSQIHIGPEGTGTSLQTFKRMTGESEIAESPETKIYNIYEAIRTGAKAFLVAEYTLCMIFIAVFSVVVFVLTSRDADGTSNSTVGMLTATSFAVGGITSMVCGYIGMMVAVFSNARTTQMARADGPAGWTGSFNTAFRAGGVMGFSLSAISLLVFHALIVSFCSHYDPTKGDAATQGKNTVRLAECMAGYGLGGSCIALFGRVGGGIYTKAADVGADLAGKVVQDIPEDDPRNPATIADNVGDNVGDVAGMGSDLFGSFAEATCAALVVGSHSPQIVAAGWGAFMFPVCISAIGIICCMLTSFIATNIQPVRCEADVEKVLKVQLGVSTLLMTMIVLPMSSSFLPPSFHIGPLTENGWDVTPSDAFSCVAAGLWAGCIIGFVTEYYTSHSYNPTREVAQSCETGAATNIIYGLALGYKSCIIPIFLISGTVYISFSKAGMYGVALSALGMLGTLCTCLTIDVYGPVCDNAGGIAEMAELPESVRDKTDALDAAGNTTAAIGKGFAIGSACLVAIALFGGFVTRAGLEETGFNILKPISFCFLLIGAMVPYWFTAMTMKSVGVAAMEMVKEVKFQFATIPGLLEGTPGHGPPDHARCIKISTDASLREMIPPGLLVILAPIITGALFGVMAVSGLLTGAIVSAVQLAISQSNTGGAWDNAKKYVEKGCVKIEDAEGRRIVQGKGTDIHKAAVTGDTVGDPLKDTSGPALNIVMKLQAIIALVFADFFMSINCGQGYMSIPDTVLKGICAAKKAGGGP